MQHIHLSAVQSASSRRGGSFLRQLSMQVSDYDADGAAAGLETVMWTRELAKRLLLPRADVEGLEDLLDTYFMLARPFACALHLQVVDGTFSILSKRAFCWHALVSEVAVPLLLRPCLNSQLSSRPTWIRWLI